jgi:hypothetical protein
MGAGKAAPAMKRRGRKPAGVRGRRGVGRPPRPTSEKLAELIIEARKHLAGLEKLKAEVDAFEKMRAALREIEF